MTQHLIVKLIITLTVGPGAKFSKHICKIRRIFHTSEGSCKCQFIAIMLLEQRFISLLIELMLLLRNVSKNPEVHVHQC